MLSSANRFNQAVRTVFLHEGHLSDDKDDLGGITNYGISLRYLESKGYDIDGDGDVDADDIRALTLDGAKGIYKNDWWEAYGYNRIEDLTLATKVFDLSVNMGPKRAHKLLQIAINRLKEKPISVDGVLGPLTVAAANNENQHALLTELKSCAAHFYRNLAADKPRLMKFLKGWLNRAYS